MDSLGVVLVAAGSAALLFLPFVVFKSNRIVPGNPCTLAQVLPAWGAFGCAAALALAGGAALWAANARVRLLLALLGVVAVAAAVAAAGDALTPPGDRIVRIAPGGAF
jgi:osmoprotectant transport system permease protein